MGSMKPHLVTFAGVCISLLIINQIAPLQAALFKNYLGIGTTTS